MAEEITVHLCHAQTSGTGSGLDLVSPLQLDLISNDSIAALSRLGLSATAVGRELGADFALTGTIARIFGNYRVRAELVRVADAVQLWVEELLVRSEPGRRDQLPQAASALMAQRAEARIRGAHLCPSIDSAINHGDVSDHSAAYNRGTRALLAS
jgi:hypothetical protein